METPSSTRRVTRSQTLDASNEKNNNSVSWMIENSEKGFSKSSRQSTAKQQDRSSLIDITNDSPIVGLATGKPETPSSFIVKQGGSRVKNTPGSGEALLRGQVKTLLQKVEEEAEPAKISLESRPFLHLMNFIKFPKGSVAPAPANTPQALNFSEDPSVEQSTGFRSEAPSSIIEERIELISKAVNDIFDGNCRDNLQSEKTQLTRSLLLDFSEKSEISDSSTCSSALTAPQETESKKKPSSEGEDESIWSIQVTASTHNEEVDYDEIDEEDDMDDECMVDALCAGMSKINMNDNTMFPKFVGKHTRFIYNSDDELVEEQLCSQKLDGACVSPNVLRLKGLPTPQGEHVRFQVEEEGEVEEQADE